MNLTYLFVPLHKAYDEGFGSTGDAFKEAADFLLNSQINKTSIQNLQLPINYLYRHAIELFIKSAIFIIHKRFQLPYGSTPCSGEPHVWNGSEWRPFVRTHSIRILWNYLKKVLADNESNLKSITEIDWIFPAEMEDWIATIEAADPRSTFFRYPDTRHPANDEKKAKTTWLSPKDLAEHLETPHNPTITVALLDSDRNIVGGYIESSDSLAQLSTALENAAEMLSGTHCALRSEICKGL